MEVKRGTTGSKKGAKGMSVRKLLLLDMGNAVTNMISNTERVEKAMID